MRAGRSTLFFAAAVLLAGAAPLRAAPLPGEPKPFPVTPTQKLQDEGGVYTVDGVVRIPRGVEISVFKGIEIRGVGTKLPAVIEVEGGFDAVGVLGGEVVLKDILVRPAATFEGIRIVAAIFQGRGGLANAPEAPPDGKTLRVEHTCFMKPSSVELSLQAGWVDLATSCCELPVRIRGVEPASDRKNRLKVSIRNCNDDMRYKCPGHKGNQGLLGGLSIECVEEVDVGSSSLGGEVVSVKDWRGRFLFDGNKVTAKRFEFRNSEPGMMGKVQCAKCDVYTTEFLAYAPPKPGLRDVLTMDRCWFRGIEDPKEVLLKVIRDGDDVPQGNGARVSLPKVNAKPLELGGPAK